MGEVLWYYFYWVINCVDWVILAFLFLFFVNDKFVLWIIIVLFVVGMFGFYFFEGVN